MQPRGPRKLSPEQHRDLIKKYNISIEGPIRSRDWPRKYSHIFGLVRDTESVRYEEYYHKDSESDSAKLLHITHMRNRVEELVDKAYDLRSSLDNEETWRLTMEHLILKRFETEATCHVCSDRLWISDFQAVPSCPISANTLKAVRESRLLCRCAEGVRAKLLAQSSSPKTFVTKGSSTIIDTEMIEIQSKILPYQKPDRVIGLGRNPELEELVAANPEIRDNLIKNKMDTYFPFLVLEAKSEKGTAGFESVERQTAFPIRAMLNVQNSLKTASIPPLDPLVWFLANRGEEWRVYGCVPDRSRILIIDLWHGCILRHDSALQLLLIVDLLCDWARDIFTEQVICSLRERAGPEYLQQTSQCSVEELSFPRPSLSDTLEEHSFDGGSTPAPIRGTHSSSEPSPNASSQNTSANSTPLNSQSSTSNTQLDLQRSSADAESSTPPPDPGTSTSVEWPDIAERETPSDIYNNMPTTTASLKRKSDKSCPDPVEDKETLLILPNRWARTVALRSDKHIRFQFRSISLPESPGELYPIVHAMTGEGTTSQKTLKLLDLVKPPNPLIIESKFLDRLQVAWGRSAGDRRRGSATQLYASLNWQATFDNKEWILTNELTCITASRKAIEALFSMCKMLPPEQLPATSLEPRLIHPLRYLPFPELVQAASQKLSLHLKVSNGVARPAGWVPDFRKARVLKRFWGDRASDPYAFKTCPENLSFESRRPPSANRDWDVIEMPPSLQVASDVRKHRAALLKRPERSEFRQREPLYCIYTLDSLNFSSRLAVGRAIQSCLCQYDSLQCEGSLTPTDTAVLGQLATMLLDPQSPRKVKRVQIAT